MSRICEFCGKHPKAGNSILRRGQAKKTGGIGQHVTAVSPRLFRPNIQSVRALVNGRATRVKICAACLRSGKVEKVQARAARAA